MLSLVKLQASTSKNTQDNDMAIEDVIQPQLSHNSARSKVIPVFLRRTDDLTVWLRVMAFETW